MSLLLRAVVGRPDACLAPELALVAIVAGRLAALATRPAARGAGGAAALLEHHRIVQAIFERAPCLPARFGGVFADERALGMRLAEREDELGSTLARIGHRGELAITLAWRDEGAAAEMVGLADGSGRAFLERAAVRARSQSARSRRAKEIVVRLLAELPVERAFVSHETCPRPAVAVSMSALVTRDEIRAIGPRIERLCAELPDVTATVHGPWAPYTFAVPA